MSRESVFRTYNDSEDDPAGDETYSSDFYLPPPVMDEDGAPLYRDGQGPGDPVRCDND